MRTHMIFNIMFAYSKDTDKEKGMFLKSNNIIVITSSDANESSKIIFASILSEYQDI